MELRLIPAEAGDGSARTIALAEGETNTLGRGEDCDIQLHDPRISRLHQAQNWALAEESQ
ncbi:MAG: FHA domain-containing protein [Planctomycetes bacterium]|nr:FHA domain-containing protein [Planctomycetota bacterium]